MAKIARAADLPRALSHRDGRTRVDLVTEETFGTTDVKADWVTYPDGGDAPAHYHTGSRHYFFVVAGSGTFVGQNETFPIATGDVIMSEEKEMHAFTSDAGAQLQFIELWVPAPTETIWQDPADNCKWAPLT